MKGVILAGGKGTRLEPLTRVTNKHLLPVGAYPMIYYPIWTLVSAGITDILLVTGGNNAGSFLELLGNGQEFGLKHLNYTYQEGHGGIADALKLAEHFVDEDKCVVILGDQILSKGIRRQVEAFRRQERGGKVLLYEVEPERAKQFGVAELNDAGHVKRIVEKPKEPPSNLVVIGVYMYDSLLWEILPTLKPSARGELEITDVNNAYIEQSVLTCDVVEGEWTDAGTSAEALYRASTLARRMTLPPL